MFLTIVGSVIWATDTRVAEIMVEGTAIPDIEISSDGRWVGFIEEGSAEVRLLDRWTWEVDAYAPCSTGVPSGLGVVELDGGDTWFVGCSNAEVVTLETDSQGGFTVGDVGVDVDTGEILLLVSNGSGAWVIAEPDSGGNPQVHSIDVSSLVADVEDGYPSTLGYSGLTDAVANDNFMVICHSGDNLSKVDLTTGSAAVRDQAAGSLVECGDLIVAPGESFLLSGGERGVLKFTTKGNDLEVMIDDDDGLVQAEALTVLASGDQLVVADNGREEFVYFTYSSTSGNSGDKETAAVSYPAEAKSDEGVTEIATTDGYSVAATDAGSLWVLTDRPWIEMSTASSGAVAQGDVLSIEATSDTDGDWELFLGGPETDGGVALASGDIVAAETLSIELTVSDTFSEGENLLYLEVVDSNGMAGHDGAMLSVDNPPGQVSLDVDSIGFGNQQLTLSFDGLDDADLDHYMVYLSTALFEGGDYPSGGPNFDGDDAIEAPWSVAATPGENVTLTISPLTNGTTYYLSVRAVDTGGLEGEMSMVVSATPQPTAGAAALSGEVGGWCGSPIRPAGILAGLAGLLILSRRRRCGVLVTGLICFLPSAVNAKERSKLRAPEDRRGSVELRYGPIWLDDVVMQTVFGDAGNQALWMEWGPHLSDRFEMTLGAGFYQEMGYLLGDTGACQDALDGSDLDSIATACEVSSEHDMMTAIPLSLGLSGRLDLREEQFFVPTIGAGGEYWLWRENWYTNSDSEEASSIQGGKVGWHWSAGVDLRLDRLEPVRAFSLQRSSGIDNSWLTLLYRQQTVGSSDGIRFDGRSVSVGIRFDY